MAFHADGQLAGFLLHAQTDLVGDGLHLSRVGARAKDEVVGEGGDAREVENLDIGGFFGFGCADGHEPG